MERDRYTYWFHYWPNAIEATRSWVEFGKRCSITSGTGPQGQRWRMRVHGVD